MIFLPHQEDESSNQNEDKFERKYSFFPYLLLGFVIKKYDWLEYLFEFNVRDTIIIHY